jgi:NAD-dependent dihydropyrimidine dehydrogenase PreA subunit
LLDGLTLSGGYRPPATAAGYRCCRRLSISFHATLTSGRRAESDMPYIITEPCIDIKDKSCVDVCPVDCIYEGEKMLYIHPDECIDCGACEPECPVTAIFPEEDVPAAQQQYIQINRDVFKSETPPGKPSRK